MTTPTAPAPYRLCCGQQHYGPVCPDGLFMCCICFERVPAADAYTDAEGKWDMCGPCGERGGVG